MSGISLRNSYCILILVIFNVLKILKRFTSLITDNYDKQVTARTGWKFKFLRYWRFPVARVMLNVSLKYEPQVMLNHFLFLTLYENNNYYKNISKLL